MDTGLLRGWRGGGGYDIEGGSVTLQLGVMGGPCKLSHPGLGLRPGSYRFYVIQTYKITIAR